MDRDQRVAGAVVGSAVGDALGAPFEFSRERTFSARFPQPDPDNEMCGGGSWEPGEATDDPDQATEFNGAVWPCLGSAVWALRTTTSFDAALRTAVDLGGDTDTVAAVTGGLAGAVYGLDAIPAPWTRPLHLLLPGTGGRELDLADLTTLAARLDKQPTE
ncbi:ADP-ribosylglycohydrolase family protein [Streptacidiphilus sp. N1-12]|uniref:ADP-ribosylglycohydrolase family protein n=2 Tax=Streptacidiphilus alkalitolerans TaxID=3342712 RepID=A0ABV6WDT0_9ACTN